jgi:hypothetical protein
MLCCKNVIQFTQTGDESYIKVGIMTYWKSEHRYRLSMSDEATADLERIAETDPDTADDIFAWLEWIQDDEARVRRLHEDRYGEQRPKNDSDPGFSIRKWVETWKGRDPLALWRLKLWDLEQDGIRYRIIYAYQIESRCFWVLGVVHRDFNYDFNHPTTKRILAQAAKLELG